MEAFIDYYLLKNSSKSAHTKTAIIQAIKRLQKITGKEYAEWDVNTFKDDTKIMDDNIENYALNTIIQNVLTILRFLEYKEAPEQIKTSYKTVLNELVNERNKTDYAQQKTPEEEANWINWEELNKKVIEASPDYLDKKHAFTDYRNFLILALYTLQPPARIGNYLNMRVKDTTKLKLDPSKLNKKFNYIYKNQDGKWVMVWNNYKTSKYIGKITHIIDNEILNKLIDKWLAEYNNKKTDIFLINYSGKSMTQTNFTNAQMSISKKILDKQLTTNDFRHIFLTYFMSKNPSVEEKIKMGEIIGQKYKPTRMELYERKN